MALADVRGFDELYALIGNGVNEGDDDRRHLVELLQREGLIRKCGRCSRCGANCKLGKDANFKGGYCSYCSRCRRKRCLTTGSFFENTHLSFQKVIKLLFFWALHISVRTSVLATLVSKPSVVQYFSFFRNLCSWKLVEEADRFIFGGPGCVVQIDESVVTRRKYNRGRVVKEKWVLGIYDTSLRRGVVLYVCRRDRQTLVPLIQDYVLPGTTIYTDGWPAYAGLNRAGYVHMVVNHKDNFVDPTTGVCANAFEGYWAKLKRFLRQTDTMKSRLLPEHIDEFMWRDAYCEDDNVFKKIIEVIRERYPL